MGDRIPDASGAALWDLPEGAVGLRGRGRRAVVQVQTVIRGFGGRDGLLAAAAERESERAARQRDETPAGDLAAAAQIQFARREHRNLLHPHNPFRDPEVRCAGVVQPSAQFCLIDY